MLKLGKMVNKKNLILLINFVTLVLLAVLVSRSNKEGFEAEGHVQTTIDKCHAFCDSLSTPGPQGPQGPQGPRGGPPRPRFFPRSTGPVRVPNQRFFPTPVRTPGVTPVRTPGVTPSLRGGLNRTSVRQ